MASTESSSDGTVCLLPSQVVFLGDALKTVANDVRLTLKRRLRPSGHEFMVLEDITRHMDVIQQALTHLSPRIDGLMSDVIQNEQAGAVEAGRAVGRLEQVLSEFVDGYLNVKASHAGPDSCEARTLILGVYRHHIREICDWLDELVDVIASPASAMQKRGLDAAQEVALTVALNMTSPPEMAKLDALAKGMMRLSDGVSKFAPTFNETATRGPGVLETIGALAFGVGVAKAVFGWNRI